MPRTSHFFFPEFSQGLPEVSVYSALILDSTFAWPISLPGLNYEALTECFEQYVARFFEVSSQYGADSCVVNMSKARHSLKIMNMAQKPEDFIQFFNVFNLVKYPS